MTIVQLREGIAFLTNPDIPKDLSMYIVMDNHAIRHANLDDESRTELMNRFLNYLHSRLNNEELIYAPISANQDRSNTIYHYDLHVLPDGLQVMGTVMNNEEQPEFSVAHDGFENITGFVFLIGNEVNKITVYKKHHKISLIRQSNKFMSFRKSDTGLTQIDEDILKISENFEFLQIGQNVVVFSTKTLENNFGYLGILHAAAKMKFDLISDAELIENIEELEELIIEKRYAKRMISINAATPVLALPFDKIREFVLGHPKLRRRLKFNDGNDKIKFHSKKSKELFMDLLTDSFLKSELTELLYHSSLKDQLSNEEEVE